MMLYATSLTTTLAPLIVLRVLGGLFGLFFFGVFLFGVILFAVLG